MQISVMAHIASCSFYMAWLSDRYPDTGIDVRGDTLHTMIVVAVAFYVWLPGVLLTRKRTDTTWKLGSLTFTFALTSQVVLMNALNMAWYRPELLDFQGTITHDYQTLRHVLTVTLPLRTHSWTVENGSSHTDCAMVTRQRRGTAKERPARAASVVISGSRL